MKPFVLCLALLATLFVVHADARAAEPTADEKKRAGEYYGEGEKLYRQELYAAAIENFKKAQAIMPHPANLYNIARAYEKLGDAENCVRGYDEYVALYKSRNDGKDPNDIVDVRASVSKCRLLMRPEITIGSDPEGAKVYIDDKTKLLGQTSYKTTLDPGKYKLFLVMDGFVPFEESIEVRAGEPLKLFFKLEKFQRVGRVRVKANVRGASLFIDGRNIGLTPYKDFITLDEGAHQVAMNKEAYGAFNREIKVEVNQDSEVISEIYLRDAPMTWKGYVGWTSLVVGVGLGVGGFFAGREADKYFKGTDDFEQWATLQKAGYGAGAGLLGIGIGLVIWDALDDELVKSGDKLDPYAVGPRITPLVGFSGTSGMVGADMKF